MNMFDFHIIIKENTIHLFETRKAYDTQEVRFECKKLSTIFFLKRFKIVESGHMQGINFDKNNITEIIEATTVLYKDPRYFLYRRFASKRLLMSKQDFLNYIKNKLE